MGRILFKETCSVFAELLWPTRCAGCDEAETLLCDSCIASLTWIDQRYACPVCGAPFGWLVCTECKSEWEAATSVSAFTYDGVVARLIKVYKDQFEVRLAPVLAAAIVGAIEEAQAWETKQAQLKALLGTAPPQPAPRISLDAFDAVTFVPATRSAYKRRGFDHMEHVAQQTAHLLGLPLADVLIHEESADQRKLGRLDRVENMRGKFEVARDVCGSRLLLLDDVITTGATVREATRALLARGAKQVHIASVARTW